MDLICYAVLAGLELAWGPTGIPVTLLCPSSDGLGVIFETKDGDVLGGDPALARVVTPRV